MSRPWGWSISTDEEDEYLVSRIKTGTPASASALLVGMSIVSVNGRAPTSSKNIDKLANVSNSVTLTVQYNPSNVKARDREGALYYCHHHSKPLENFDEAAKEAKSWYAKQAFCQVIRCLGRPRLRDEQGALQLDKQGRPLRGSCEKSGRGLLETHNGCLFFRFCQACKSGHGIAGEEVTDPMVVCWKCLLDHEEEKREAQTSNGFKSSRSRRNS